MGVTNQIIEIIQEEELKKRTCSLCSNPIMTRENCWLLFRTNNDTDWTNFTIGTSRGWIAIEIELEHRECPETKECEGCFNHILKPKGHRE